MDKDIKIFAKTIEQSALDQINTLLGTGIFDGSKIRIMPDCHSGAGCVIGFTAELKDKVVSNLIGVDLNCGVIVSELSKKPDTKKLQGAIEKYVPYGREVHEKDYFGGNIPDLFKERYRRIKSLLLELRCYRYLKDARRLALSIGSLGGGEVKKKLPPGYIKDIHCKTRPYREKL